MGPAAASDISNQPSSSKDLKCPEMISGGEVRVWRYCMSKNVDVAAHVQLLRLLLDGQELEDEQEAGALCGTSSSGRIREVGGLS